VCKPEKYLTFCLCDCLRGVCKLWSWCRLQIDNMQVLGGCECMCLCVLHSAICATGLHCDFGHLLHPLYSHQHLADIWLWSGWFLLSHLGEETGCSFRLFWVFRSRSKCVNPAELGSSWTMHYYIMERCNNIQHNICSLHFSILWRLYLYQNHNGLRSVPLTKGSVHLTSKQTIRHVSFDHWNGWINLDMEFSSNFSCNLSNNNQEGVWCEEHLLSWSIITVMSNCLSEG
jgi:hypothetical protein